MRREHAQERTCVGTGFIALDIIRSKIDGAISEQRFAGGSCGNVLAILSYLGWSSLAVGRIGDDRLGRELVSDLTKWRVQTGWLRKEQGRGTPVVIQENYTDARGRPRHRFSRACPECGASLPGYRPLLIADASPIAAELPPHAVFYFDRVAPGNLALARKSREAGALVVFEPSGIKDERLFRECLRVAHVLKYSRERLAGVDAFVVDERVPVEVETLGAAGLRVRTRRANRQGTRRSLPAFSTPHLRDAAGSGDWCTAGLIERLLRARTRLEEAVGDEEAVVAALRYGQALAALNCGFEGARGLMYAAAAEEVDRLAAAVVRNGAIKNAPSAKPGEEISRRGAVSECAICSSLMHTRHGT